MNFLPLKVLVTAVRFPAINLICSCNAVQNWQTSSASVILLCMKYSGAQPHPSPPYKFATWVYCVKPIKTVPTLLKSFSYCPYKTLSSLHLYKPRPRTTFNLHLKNNFISNLMSFTHLKEHHSIAP